MRTDLEDSIFSRILHAAISIGITCCGGILFFFCANNIYAIAQKGEFTFIHFMAGSIAIGFAAEGVRIANLGVRLLITALTGSTEQFDKTLELY